MISFRSSLRVYLCLLAALLAGGRADAFLGSFEEEDGYRIPLNGQIASAMLGTDAQFYLNNNPANGFTGVVPVGAYPNTLGDGDGGWHGADVTRYNAGSYGTSGGGPGGTAVDIADNSGQWRALAGGRLNEDAAAPYYSGSQLVRDHIVGYKYLYSHTGTQSLNVFAAEANLSYAYLLDSRDLQGLNPATTASSLIQMSFWVQPTDWDNEDTGHLMGLSLVDSMDQSIFEVGYTGDNFLQYRLPGQGSAWQTTAYQLGSNGWSQISLAVDNLADTASLTIRAYSDVLHSLTDSVIILNEAAMGLDADALYALQWDVRGGTLDNGAVSYIHYFDDFAFAITPGVPVPEPGGAVLLAVALGLCKVPRRRQRR